MYATMKFRTEGGVVPNFISNLNEYSITAVTYFICLYFEWGKHFEYFYICHFIFRQAMSVVCASAGAPNGNGQPPNDPNKKPSPSYFIDLSTKRDSDINNIDDKPTTLISEISEGYKVYVPSLDIEANIHTLTLRQLYEAWDYASKVYNEKAPESRRMIRRAIDFRRDHCKQVSLKRAWERDDDKKLIKAIKDLGTDWNKISQIMQNKSPADCLRRHVILRNMNAEDSFTRANTDFYNLGGSAEVLDPTDMGKWAAAWYRGLDQANRELFLDGFAYNLSEKGDFWTEVHNYFESTPAFEFKKVSEEKDSIISQEPTHFFTLPKEYEKDAVPETEEDRKFEVPDDVVEYEEGEDPNDGGAFEPSETEAEDEGDDEEEDDDE